ncbi:proline--tRNA ligase [Deinococcus peraridilitoris]|uniref:Proline--tRNA ligase n=1 Tax=Deinococcus peraridilitoris (strain DSM 19664 / LMG 22246 / CIP 109416 / KR-200) TaxID=937777 RepID=L0A597_DEIPD|nr:proline--tRNA ligase [Deinococcus peraridilitoris]AFZ68357.1 prolyl-tRNA synthetase, family I [Deinococcus peraridilitoris DSM 19664]
MTDAKASQFGVTPQSVDFNEWYNEVVVKADLADYSPVRGSMVVKPYGSAIWERIQRWLDDRFKETGHESLLFPTLIPMNFLQKEAQHVEGFAPELFTVTKIGTEALEEPYVLRPTSETIIGHMWSQWLNSYRDLPFLHYQWGAVFRAELRTKLFLRTAEFYWHEGHTAHATQEEAMAETMQQLDLYHEFCRDVLALPVIRGPKSASERFAGAVETFSIEGMMRDGKALQSGTSHYLGQNFAKAFDVKFQGSDQKEHFVHTTSWAISSRIIGALIMTHGDDKGLQLPPNIAPIQVVVVPVVRKDNAETMYQEADKLAAELRTNGFRVKVDKREGVSNGFKYNDWELKGVPVRIELGPRDLEAGVVVVKNRNADAKETVARMDVVAYMGLRLDEIQQALYDRALSFLQENTVTVDSYEEFKTAIEAGKWVRAFHCGDAESEAQIKEDTKATVRNIPLDGELFGEREEGVCVHTGKPSAYGKRAIFGRQY